MGGQCAGRGYTSKFDFDTGSNVSMNNMQNKLRKLEKTVAATRNEVKLLSTKLLTNKVNISETQKNINSMYTNELNPLKQGVLTNRADISKTQEIVNTMNGTINNYEDYLKSTCTNVYAQKINRMEKNIESLIQETNKFSRDLALIQSSKENWIEIGN